MSAAVKQTRGGNGGRTRSRAAGAPQWIVTFADLMSILVCFFVLIISFSIQDEQKLQIVAGSMREAFGVNLENRKTGLIEIKGSPLRDFVRWVTAVEQDSDTNIAHERHDERALPGPQANTHDIEKADVERPRRFATAAESVRQSWREMPEILELSDQIIVEDHPDGLNITIVDHDGRSMFPAGSVHPYERTRTLLAGIGRSLRELPHGIVVTGHTTADRAEGGEGASNWDLSAGRANAVRAILSGHGVAGDRFAAVTGKADVEPLFPEDPFLAANRRISILLLAEEPPMPPGMEP